MGLAGPDPGAQEGRLNKILSGTPMLIKSLGGQRHPPSKPKYYDSLSVLKFYKSSTNVRIVFELQ